MSGVGVGQRVDDYEKHLVYIFFNQLNFVLTLMDRDLRFKVF
jgi:hypothetical protein